VRKEVRALVARGHEVDVICLRDEGEAKTETVDDATIHRIALSAKRGGYLTYGYQYATFFLLSFILLTRLFFRKGYDVIHVHSLPDFQVFVALVPKLLGRKIILDLHEAMPEIFAARFGLSMKSGRVRLAAILESLSCSFADRVVTVNRAIMGRLVERGVEPEKITIVLNSPDETLSVHRDMSGFVEENDLRSKFVIMYVGGINQERNIETLIKAVSMLKAEIPIGLFVYGYGSEGYVEELKSLKSRLGVDEEVRFGGYLPQENVFSYLNLSDVGVISYVRNPLTEVAVPNKVFEFAALAKPLIIARLGALEDLFKDAALFYEPENAEDLANRILQLHKDKNLAKELVLSARKVYADFKWDVMRKRLYDVYDTLE
jgi:glycosyltransferase involved in cell wall biosynthesis